MGKDVYVYLKNSSIVWPRTLARSPRITTGAGSFSLWLVIGLLGRFYGLSLDFVLALLHNINSCGSGGGCHGCHRAFRNGAEDALVEKVLQLVLGDLVSGFRSDNHHAVLLLLLQ